MTVIVFDSTIMNSGNVKKAVTVTLGYDSMSAVADVKDTDGYVELNFGAMVPK